MKQSLLIISLSVITLLTGCMTPFPASWTAKPDPDPQPQCTGDQCKLPTPIVVENAERTKPQADPATAVPQYAIRRPTGKRLPAIHDLQDALRQAKEQNKYLFIQYGREECSNCQKIWDLLGHGDIKLPSNMLYVDVSCDDFDTRAFVETNYPLQDTGLYLPFLFIVSPQGKLLNSSSGLYPVKYYRDMIHAAINDLPAPLPILP